MSVNKNLIKLAEKLKNSSEYSEKIKDCRTSQELYDYCSSIVSGYTKEEFDNFVKGLIIINGEIPDSKLEAVSGGKLSREDAKKWSSGLSRAAGFVTIGLTLSKTVQTMYFDDIDNMKPEQIIGLVDDIINYGFELK